jgi:hypothetical protein
MWVYLYNPQTKWQSMYWKSLTLPKKQTFHANTSKGKVMLEVFFDNRTRFIKSMFHRATLWTRQCAGTFFAALEKIPSGNTCSVGEQEKWVLHHNNEPAYWSHLVDECLARHNIICVFATIISPPPPVITSFNDWKGSWKDSDLLALMRMKGLWRQHWMRSQRMPCTSASNSGITAGTGA